jgi:transketolase
VAKGGYILGDSQGKPELILIGTGSELALCVAAYEKLSSEGVRARVVSLPSWELFELQTQAYRDSVLPPDVRARVSVEAGSVFGWERYVGLDGAIIGMTSFGASAPAGQLFKKFGFTVDHVIEVAKGILAKKQ